VKTLHVIACSIGLLVVALHSATAQVRITVDLRDGSHVMGKPLSKSLPLKTLFTTVALPFDQIQSLYFDTDHRVATVQMRNDDRLQGEILLKTLPVETIIGKLSISLSLVVALSTLSDVPAIVEGLVARYPLDKDENDASGNNHNGENHGSAPGADRFGIPGGARVFDGERSSIALKNTTELNFPPAPFSLSAWALVPDEAADYAILAKHVSGHFNGYVLWARGSIFGFYLSADPRIEAPVRAGAGVWHHVAGVYDGSTQFLYVDGMLVGQCAASSYQSNDAPIEIGRAYDRNYFKGSIDDVRIYDRALSAGEVLKIFHEGGWVRKK
jgi:hypothetical protein